EGKPSIWHLADILRWFEDKGKYRFDDSLLELAAVNRRFNVVKEVENLDPSVPPNLEALFG
ncbi:MAG: hypothetical protein RQ753_09685, partial [Desulfurivibrionaceae bacterium]|nr:hypothetical protein [Desulfurivibrionaceae bacterium]